MSFNDLLKMLAIGLLAVSSVAAQSSAYAKFGAHGETVGIYNLLRKPDMCTMQQVFEGVVAAVSARKRPTETEYRFALDGTVGQRLYKFALSPDDLSEVDVRDLLSKRQRVRVRACRHAGYWAVAEVTRSP
jgi:hypothetical protein